MFRTLLCFVLAFSISITAVSQDDESLFPEGYFSNPVVTPYGIVVSNERHSAIYLIDNGLIEELVSAPGAGRFLHFNNEKSKVGFKLINPDNGMQIPAILDLATFDVTLLEEPAPRVGQVSFADDGTIAYTMDTRLIARNGDRANAYDLGVYSNLTPISPDGNRAAFKDNADQLWILDLRNGAVYQITDPEKGYRGSVWSPAGDKLVFSSVGTELYYHDLGRRESISIGEGENPGWSDDGDKIVFHKKEIDFQNIELLSSDIYLYDFDEQTKIQLTDTEDVFEMDARFTPSGEEIIFHTYDAREIRLMRMSAEERGAGLYNDNDGPLLKMDEPLKTAPVSFGETFSQDTVIAGDIDWVHIHQVYDTRSDWDQGRVCCGAATIAQIFATYDIYTPWPFDTYGRTSDYGLYVSDAYTFNAITYSGYSGRWPTGAHGFLWHGGGSPRSRSVQFVTGHGISETQRDLDVSWNTVTTELDLGYSYVLCSTGLTAGHIVLAVGTYGDQNTLVINDPYGDKNAGNYGWKYNGKHALYDWADANTGREKVTPIAWGLRVRFDPDERPALISFSPDTEDSVHATSHIKFSFSQPMEREPFADAFSIVPAANGAFTWSNNNRSVTFVPDSPLTGAIQYTVKVDTSAVNVFGNNLSEAVEFGFITKSRERLAVEKMYPLHGQSGISTTVQFRFQFDGVITRGALMGNMAFLDNQGQSIGLKNIVVQEIDGKGYLAFEPGSELQYNREHTLFLYDGITDTDGYPMADTVMVRFHTTAERYVEGTIIDDFPDCDNWLLLGNEEGSNNVDMAKTQFAGTDERKISGTAAARLKYAFEGDEGSLMISNISGISIEPGQTENFGLWSFGDLSGNLLEFHFRENEAESLTITVDTLNYTGWKLVTANMTGFGSTDEMEFIGIAVRKEPGGEADGELFFDQLQKDIVTPVRDEDEHIALKEFRLHQNYPNPFNPSTSIRYDIPQESRVLMTVYNVLGQQVAVLVDEKLGPGTYETLFDAAYLPTGLYIYRLQAGDFTQTKSLLYLK